jgi:hypothetical protein
LDRMVGEGLIEKVLPVSKSAGDEACPEAT